MGRQIKEKMWKSAGKSVNSQMKRRRTNVHRQTALAIESSSTSPPEPKCYDEFRRAVEEHNVEKAEEILQVNDISETDKKVLFKYQDRDRNTFLHLLFNSIRQTSNKDKVIDVISYLIKNGVPTNRKNRQGKIPLTLLNNLKGVITVQTLREVKGALQGKKIVAKKSKSRRRAKAKYIPQESEVTAETSFPADKEKAPRYIVTESESAHGSFFEFDTGVVTNIVWTPKNQNFYLAHNRAVFKGFDDHVIMYTKDNIDTYQCIQAKHRVNDGYKITFGDLTTNVNIFNLENFYFPWKNIDDCKKICLNSDNVRLQFFLCTNVDFNDHAKSYFIKDDTCNFKLVAPAVAYKLNPEKVKEFLTLHVLDGFDDFVEQFRIIVNLNKSVLDELKSIALREYFQTDDVRQHLCCFNTLYREQSEELRKVNTMWQYKDTLKLLEDLDMIINAPFDEKFSLQLSYIFKSWKTKFESDTSGNIPNNNLNELFKTTKNSLFIVASTCPQLTTIKLIERKLNYGERMLVALARNVDKRFINRFKKNTTQYLTIFCDKGELLDMTDLYLEATIKKKIFVICHQDDLNLSEEHIVGTHNLFRSSIGELLVKVLNKIVQSFNVERVSGESSPELVFCLKKDELILTDAWKIIIDVFQSERYESFVYYINNHVTPSIASTA